MTIRTRKEQKGSALLISLMVMVGLSLLGLGFVAISETESAIAVNQRNATEALAGAEAGAQMVVEWFQDADWANRHKLLPPNVPALKTLRVLSTGSNYYKATSGELLFDTPFKLSDNNRFFGDDARADVKIDLSTAQGRDFLEKLSTALFPEGNLRISEILAYAPPMPGATNTGGFWEGGTRYGIATIAVTAQKITGDPVRVLAQRRVKAVIAETPFPTVDGAIETSGSLVGQGNFNVFWGKVLSEKDMQLARPAAGMPWFDAKQVMPFELGYNSYPEWKKTTVYKVGDIVQATGSAISASGNLTKFAFECTSLGISHVTEPAWVQSLGAATNETLGTVKWKTIVSRPYQFASGDFYTEYNWFSQLVGRTIPDPWLHARARGAIGLTNNGKPPCGDAVSPHPCDYNAVTDVIVSKMSNVFQKQTVTDVNPKPDRIEVVFPTMDYEFWKAVAQSGSNEPGTGVYYFEYDSKSPKGAMNFIGPGGKSDDVINWLNAKKNGLGPGFYFFDTLNKKNPQYGKGGELVPGTIDIGSKVGAGWQMQGYIYLNVEFFGSSGTGALDKDNMDVYNMPGEPFRDVGYRQVDPATKQYVITGPGTLPGGGFDVIGKNNTVWDFQDLNNNGVFDYKVQQTGAAIVRPDGSTIPAGTWLPVPWYPGCANIPDLADMEKQVAGDCSEPHEPYLNLLYPDSDGAKDAVVVGWHDPADGAPSRRAKLRVAKDAGVACTDETQLADCTSNGYDKDGALVSIPPILWGALYNEGGYSGSGNATYYGALLMRGNFNASGSPDVFFNECLARGCLEDQLKMQRVMITSWETDK